MPTVVIGLNTGNTGSSADAWNDTFSATTNHGNEATLTIDGANFYGFIRFDLSSISGPVTVNSATLSLRDASAYNSGTMNMGAFKMIRDWVALELTFNRWKVGNNWATAGGIGAADRAAAATGTGAFPGTAAGYSTITGLAADVQDWINNGNNQGWQLAYTTGAATGLVVNASQGTDGFRPFLTIDYTASGGTSKKLLTLGVG